MKSKARPLSNTSSFTNFGYHQEAGNFWLARSSWQYWWDTKLHVLQSNTCSWESQQLTSVNCWLWKWKDVSTFQIFFVFLGLRIFTRIYCIWSETREQNLNDLLSYNGPQFLIKNRFTYPNDLPMTSNSLFFGSFWYVPFFLIWVVLAWSKRGEPKSSVQEKGNPAPMTFISLNF